jgi:hypothetical protein
LFRFSPKIKIENGSTKCFDTSNTKPVKKEAKKSAEKTLDVKKETKKPSDDKNTLDVSSGAEHRRHKQNKIEKKSRDGGAKSKTDSAKTKHKSKCVEEKNEAPKAKKEHKRTVNKLVKQSSVKENESEAKMDERDKKDIQSAGLGQVKPPNVLVYADSLITKDNVKRVLFSILNKER